MTPCESKGVKMTLAVFNLTTFLSSTTLPVVDKSSTTDLSSNWRSQGSIWGYLKFECHPQNLRTSNLTLTVINLATFPSNLTKKGTGWPWRGQPVPGLPGLFPWIRSACKSLQMGDSSMVNSVHHRRDESTTQVPQGYGGPFWAYKSVPKNAGP